MKTIGLIGGLSWASSRDYYTLLNTEYNRRKGNNHSCPVVMYSFDFGEMETLQVEGNWMKICEKMSEAAIRIEKGGADLILICSNTMHYCAGVMQSRIMIPILHIADAAGEAIAGRGINRIALTGTRYLMNMSFYREILKIRYSIDTLLPADEEMEAINTIIYSELVKGDINDKSRRILLKIAGALAGRGAQGVLLACTELPMLLGEETTGIPLFNSTRIHALYGLDFAMKEHLYA